MMCEPEDDLKRKLKEKGISYRDVANHLGRKYSIVNNWLNGFSTMPMEARREIMRMIAEREQAIDKVQGK